LAIINDLRKKYHQQICAEVIFEKSGGIASMADVSNVLSRKVSRNLLNQIPYPVSKEEISGQTAGERLEKITKDFLEQAFAYLQHIRGGQWTFSVHNSISEFEQYQHLAELSNIVKKNKMLKTALGDYVISPDIVIGRIPISDAEINQTALLVNGLDFPMYTPIRASNKAAPSLHASISCKWTLRSDRSQNARTEGLNLIRNRKGRTPHIAVVTGEPLPSRISSLAFGTGDIDCVYHFALHELIRAVEETGEESAIETLQMMTEGHRLRDISDLPFDLAI